MSEEDGGETHWFVEAILGHKPKNLGPKIWEKNPSRITDYLVKWGGIDEETGKPWPLDWQDAAIKQEEVPELIADYWSSKAQNPKKDRKSISSTRHDGRKIFDKESDGDDDKTYFHTNRPSGSALNKDSNSTSDGINEYGDFQTKVSPKSTARIDKKLDDDEFVIDDTRTPKTKKLKKKVKKTKVDQKHVNKILQGSQADRPQSRKNSTTKSSIQAKSSTPASEKPGTKSKTKLADIKSSKRAYISTSSNSDVPLSKLVTPKPADGKPFKRVCISPSSDSQLENNGKLATPTRPKKKKKKKGSDEYVKKSVAETVKLARQRQKSGDISIARADDRVPPFANALPPPPPVKRTLASKSARKPSTKSKDKDQSKPGGLTEKQLIPSGLKSALEQSKSPTKIPVPNVIELSESSNPPGSKNETSIKLTPDRKKKGPTGPSPPSKSTATTSTPTSPNTETLKTPEPTRETPKTARSLVRSIFNPDKISPKPAPKPQKPVSTLVDSKNGPQNTTSTAVPTKTDKKVEKKPKKKKSRKLSNSAPPKDNPSSQAKPSNPQPDNVPEVPQNAIKPSVNELLEKIKHASRNVTPEKVPVQQKTHTPLPALPHIYRTRSASTSPSERMLASAGGSDLDGDKFDNRASAPAGRKRSASQPKVPQLCNSVHRNRVSSDNDSSQSKIVIAKKVAPPPLLTKERASSDSECKEKLKICESDESFTHNPRQTKTQTDTATVPTNLPLHGPPPTQFKRQSSNKSSPETSIVQTDPESLGRASPDHVSSNQVFKVSQFKKETGQDLTFISENNETCSVSISNIVAEKFGQTVSEKPTESDFIEILPVQGFLVYDSSHEKPRQKYWLPLPLFEDPVWVPFLQSLLGKFILLGKQLKAKSKKGFCYKQSWRIPNLTSDDVSKACDFLHDASLPHQPTPQIIEFRLPSDIRWHSPQRRRPKNVESEVIPINEFINLQSREAQLYNDDIINTFCGQMSADHEQMIFLDTKFSETWAQAEGDALQYFRSRELTAAEKEKVKMKSLMMRSRDLLGLLRNDINQYHFIVIPVSVRRFHWSLCYINLKSHEIVYIDRKYAAINSLPYRPEDEMYTTEFTMWTKKLGEFLNKEILTENIEWKYRIMCKEPDDPATVKRARATTPEIALDIFSADEIQDDQHSCGSILCAQIQMLANIGRIDDSLRAEHFQEFSLQLAAHFLKTRFVRPEEGEMEAS